MPNFSDLVIHKFPHTPTSGQRRFFNKMDQFLSVEGNAFFLLKGYAGTGKTSIVTALVRTLPSFNYKFVLIAPTGRAAKVMTYYSDRKAFTVHRIIYKQTGDPGSGQLIFKPQKNYHKKTIFIVDEASMLSVQSEFGTSGLLEDLIKFTFRHSENKLILIGDSAQLPPIGQSESVALKNDYYSFFNVPLFEEELDEVMRQEKESGILHNATMLRLRLTNEQKETKFQTKFFSDIYRMTADRMEEGLRYAYNKYGSGNTIIVCRTNKSAVNYNTFIRRQIHFFDNELDVGDIIMAVRNNYRYAPPDSPSGFMANGDFMEIVKILNFEELYGFRFADLELRMYGTGNREPFVAKVLLDTLYSSTTSLSEEQNSFLWKQVAEDYIHIKSNKERKEAMASDEYLNAIQIKFAYALTCHKAQGGQWNAVFIDQGYYHADEADSDRVKWLYTAVTRATDELFLVNFHASQFED